jgi:hypothetical protein
MRTLLAITLLALSASVSAAAEESCNLGSLQGRFVFTGRGFIEAAQPEVQRVHYGIFVFDGTGKFVGKQSKSGAKNSKAPIRWKPTAPER